MSEPSHSPRIYLLPNLFTAGNLFCGFFAILRIFEGMQVSDGGTHYYHEAIWLILGACLFDLLDGRVARIKGQESPFGREFDSLADIVSFGVAPALLLMDIVLKDFDRLGWIVAFIYLCCGAMRLARFNCMSTEKSGDGPNDFTGFPIPASAGVISSLTLFLLWLNEGERDLGAWRFVLLLLMMGMSALMMSNVRYPSFKKINVRTKRSLIWVLVAILVLLVTVAYRYFMPAVLFMSYLIYGFVRPWISLRWRREIEEAPEDNELEAEPAESGPEI